MGNSKKGRREGEVLKGKYRLDRHIATGGMGEVYQATNVALGRTVAVKVLLDEFLADESSIQRFLLEARAASMVQHKNIVQVFDIDKTESGIPFIVQEFLQGETLSRRIRRTREGIPGRQLLDILIPAIEAIGEAHKAGIVHRDIKPSNIFLTKGEGGVTAKVLDFGVSRISSVEDDARLTKATAMLGSPAYMSPEQIQSPRDATARSDVWSIGVMMYELLSGELPFRGKTSSEIMVNVCTQEVVSLRESAPGISPGLAEVVTRCLSRVPQERYLDGESLAQALREVKEQEYSAKKVAAPESTTPEQANASLEIQESSIAVGGPEIPSALSIEDAPANVSGSQSTVQTTEQRLVTGANDASQSGDYRHPSYGDIPYIVGGFAILIGLLILSAVFTPQNLAATAKEISGATQLLQVLVAAGMIYLAQLVGYKAGQFSGAGSTIAVIGLYGVCATLLLLSGAQYLGEQAILPVLIIIMSISVATTSFGFAIVGFEYVKDQVLTESQVTGPGVAVAVFTLMAIVIGFQFLNWSI